MLGIACHLAAKTEITDVTMLGIAIGATVAAVASCALLTPLAAVADTSASSAIGIGTLATAAAADPALEDEALSRGVRLTDAVTGEVTDLAGYPRLGPNALSVNIGKWGEGIVQKLLPMASRFPNILKGAGDTFEGDFATELETGGNLGVDSKVGGSFDSPQAQDYADAVNFGKSLFNLPGVTRVSGGIITDAYYYF